MHTSLSAAAIVESSCIRGESRYAPFFLANRCRNFSGGPVKHNKMFAFAAYQHTLARPAQAATQATVPTAANLAGDYSLTDGVPGVSGSNPCNSSHNPIPLVDPLTGTALVGNKYSSTPT
jgi:hypothetical protein